MMLDKYYEIIRRPLITEKATMISESNQVAFVVARHAAKGDVKAAIEALFDVKVKAVNILNRKGKQRRFRGRRGKSPDTRIAYVRLHPGQEIDVTGGA